MDNMSENSQRTHYKKRTMWSIEAEELLLALWTQNIAKFLKNKLKFYILSKMSTKMEEMGYPFTAYEISTKIQNLKTRYRIERKRVLDGYPSPWPMYDSVHSIMERYQVDQNEIKNDGNENSTADSNYSNQNHHPEDQYDDANYDDYREEDSYDNADETAATSPMSESRDNTQNNETKYLKSINNSLLLLAEKINELNEQSQSMEKERSASLKQLLDIFKYQTREGTTEHNWTRRHPERNVKKINLSKPNDMGVTTHNQDHVYESILQSIQDDDPLCNESTDDQEDISSPAKKSLTVPCTKFVLDKKLKEEYLKTKQLERNFMAEKHKLQMDILNLELEAKKKTDSNYSNQNHHPEDQYDDANYDDYREEDSYDNADETAATSPMSESRDNTQNNETKYLKSINNSLLLLAEKINELNEQSQSMEKERSASLKQLLDIFKYQTREGTTEHNWTRRHPERNVKKINLSKPNDMGVTTHNQDHVYESILQSIQDDDPLCNESTDDQEDISSPAKKSLTVPCTKFVLDKKLKEEYLKTKQLERNFMAEKHKLQMDILNLELEAKKKSKLK